jgi:hypothetical protein
MYNYYDTYYFVYELLCIGAVSDYHVGLGRIARFASLLDHVLPYSDHGSHSRPDPQETSQRHQDGC